MISFFTSFKVRQIINYDETKQIYENKHDKKISEEKTKHYSEKKMERQFLMHMQCLFVCLFVLFNLIMG